MRARKSYCDAVLIFSCGVFTSAACFDAQQQQQQQQSHHTYASTATPGIDNFINCS
jgi:hypothetical protein